MRREFEQIIDQVQSDVGTAGHTHTLIIHPEPHWALLPSRPTNPVEVDSHTGMTYRIRLPPNYDNFGPLAQFFARSFDEGFSKLKPTPLQDKAKSLPRAFGREIYREGAEPGYPIRSGHDLFVHFNVPNDKVQRVADAFADALGAAHVPCKPDAKISKAFPVTTLKKR